MYIIISIVCYTFFQRKKKMSNDTVKKQLNLSKQYLNSTTADVFFICGDDDYKESVPAHKFLLFTNSDVFEKMFNGSLPEGNMIRITDASGPGFRAFLRYFYFDETYYNFNIEIVGEIIYLAEKYNIREFFASCYRFLMEGNTPKHILIGYKLAIAYELDDLSQMLKLKILERSDEIFVCEYIRSVSRDFLKCILQIKHIGIYAKLMFDACLSWAENACKKANVDPAVMQNRRNQLNDVFQLIEFGAMTRDEIVITVMTFGDIFTSQELRRFIVMIAAKSSIPFNTDEMINYNIGRAITQHQQIQFDSMEELHFNVRNKILLGGIETATIFCEQFAYNGINKVSGIASIVKVSPERSKFDDIVLLRGAFSIEIHNSSTKGIIAHNKILFPETIIVESHFKYAIQLTFLSKTANALYYKQAVSLSEKLLFRILPETNCSVVCAFLYNRL